MIDWFRGWAKGIVIAVIITSLIEMILPNNNSKKYIKVIIGIFIVYTIISPAITWFSDKDIDELVDSNDFVEASSNSYEAKEMNGANKYIKNIYVKNLQNDISQKLKSKGYLADNIVVEIYDDESYQIKSISISICGKETVSDNKKQARSIVDTIKKVTIEVNKNCEEILGTEEKNSVKEYISKTYEISSEQVQILSGKVGDNN
ncbi:MAG: stage III sporulation protein AF [Clostridia bacterium]|nr:stage III sporulation protein AF [Clostridia bacterium]